MTSSTQRKSSFLAFVDWPTLRVFGPDARTWLNAIVTNDVASVGKGRGSWGSLLTKQGKVQADLQFVGTDEEIFVAVSGGDAEQVQSTLDGYLIMEDAEIESSDLRWVIAVGKEARAHLDAAGFSASLLPWGETDVSAVCAADDLLNQLRSEHAELVLSQDEWSAWLVEHGVPRFGVEYDGGDNLHAASLERRTVDWSKGCYLGQEVVCMQDMRGKVKKRLVKLTADALIPAAREVTLPDEEEPVGRVVSSAGVVAIASVSAPHFEAGTALSVGELSVTVKPLQN